MQSQIAVALAEGSASTGRHIPALDGVRAVACLVVVAAHAEAFGLRGHGGAGVWLFFVLSAFLLTRIYGSVPASIVRPRRLSRYCLRRVARVVPLYALVVWGLYRFKHHDPRVLVDHLTFARADGVFWTIPQELLFYAALPVLLLLAAALRRRRLTLAALLVSAYACNHLLKVDVFALRGNGKLLPWELQIFLLGMAAAYAVDDPAVVAARDRAPWLFDLGALLLLLGVVLSSPENVGSAAAALQLELPHKVLPCWHFRGSYGIACACLLVAISQPTSRASAFVLAARPVRLIGILSYAIYLLHPIALELISPFKFAPAATFALATGLAGVAAAVSYELFEGPLMALARGRQAARRPPLVR